MRKKRYRKGVFLVVYCQSKGYLRYLLLKRKLHWKGWEFPKAGCEPKESKEKCVKREFKEETGLKIAKITRHNKHGKYKYSRKLADREGFIGQTYSLYSIKVKKCSARLDKKEHSAYKWADYKTASKMLKWGNQRNCLRIVNQKITAKQQKF